MWPQGHIHDVRRVRGLRGEGIPTAPIRPRVHPATTLWRMFLERGFHPGTVNYASLLGAGLRSQ